MNKGLLIETVVEGSIAAEMEIEAGDRLLAVNDKPVSDIIDYHYHTADEELLLLVLKGSGELWEVEIDNSEGAPLGICFHAPSPSCCGNNCIFCFVHQLPKGLRKPLYVKDEDYRLSFLYGNYVTLTNITQAELTRIKEQKLSPLYISVHVTDEMIRQKMLGRSGIPPLLPMMKDLAAAGISMHTQIVLCPGINDGEFLKKSLSDLAALYPRVASLAVVPVGLTAHRQKLPSLEPVSSEYAAQFIQEWTSIKEEIDERLGEPFLFFADEFYLKAALPFPASITYGDFPQLENGVGMIPLFEEEAAEVLAGLEPIGVGKATVVTGLSPLAHIEAFMQAVSVKMGVSIKVEGVVNTLFGSQVTVTGLVSGRDIVATLGGRVDLGVLLVPDVMLKEGEGIFLDDTTLDALAEQLHCRVEVFPANPEGFCQKLVELFPC